MCVKVPAWYPVGMLFIDVVLLVTVSLSKTSQSGINVLSIHLITNQPSQNDILICFELACIT